MLRQECANKHKKILRGFIEAFGDGHLELKWPKPSDQKTADQPRRIQPPRGATIHMPPPGLQALLDAWRRLFANSQPVQALSAVTLIWFLPAGFCNCKTGQTGVIRIALFSGHAERSKPLSHNGNSE